MKLHLHVLLSSIRTEPVLPPSGAPMNFTVRVDGPRTITFSWIPPERDHQNGPIIGYYLFCHSPLHDYQRFISNDAEEYNELSSKTLTLAEFVPNSIYNCSVSATTSSGQGPGTSLSAFTPEDGKELLTCIAIASKNFVL